MMVSALFRNWYEQIRTLVPLLLWVYATILILLIGLTLFALLMGHRVWYLTADPFIIGNLPFYAGVLSNLGFLFWCGATAVCFFGAFLLGERASQSTWRRFLVFSGLFSLMVLLDDLFQLHRIFFPEKAEFPVAMVHLVIGGLGLGYFILFRKQILMTEYLMLGLAGGFLFSAALVDIFSPLPRGNTAVSDFLKFYGIVSWFIYFFRTSRDVVNFFNFSTQDTQKSEKQKEKG